MILRDRYEGREAPFQGDRELYLRHLPADARIVSARATIIPVDRSGGQDPFVETIRFQGATGDWGATKTATAGAVEVDFHGRRTLAGVQGSALNGTNLQVDLGGAFLPVSDNGSVGGPGTALDLDSDSTPLPGLTVTRFRLTGAGNPDVTSVRVRSIPGNVTLALRGRPSFWFFAGEMATPQTTTDFITILAAYLPEAEIKDGYYFLPFVLHADGIARLDVELEIEYVRSASVLPNGLAEATLPFAFGSLPASSTALALSLPGNAALARGKSLGRALGAFESTRVAFGPTGLVSGPERTALASPSASLAQPVSVPATIEIVAVDLLLAAAGRAARMTINLVEDLDGKPGGRSFWPAPVPFALTPETSAQLAWASVALPAPFQIHPETKSWLVLQSLDGDVTWSARDAAPTSPGLHRTDDGGLSWRRAGTAPLAALFRLRDQPKDFRMPIELEVGSGETARRVSLRRFDPQRRVELPFNLPEIEDAFEKVLAEATPTGCPRGEHLADGSFEQWVKVGDRLGEPQRVREQEDIVSSSAVAVSPDGRRAYVLGSGDTEASTLHVVELGCGRTAGTVELAGSARAFAVHPGGTRAYALLNGNQLQVIDLESLRPLGAPLGIFLPSLALAVSPDGGTLYLGLVSSGSVGLTPGMGTGGNIVAFETARLEEAALRGEMELVGLISRVAPLGGNRDPIALVASSDGSRLWALLQGGNASEILPLETPSLRVLNTLSIALPGGAPPFDLAVTADGATAVAVRDDLVEIVDLAGRKITATLGVLGDHVAIEPDGRRAFVSRGGEMHVIDLARRAEVTPPVVVGEELSGLAVTPQGDRVLLTDTEEGGLHAVPIGVPAPAEWILVSGRVAPGCLSDPSRPVALLGGLGDDAPTTDSVVAQVVPIAAQCNYELAFDGVAIGDGAVAEVLWRGSGCAAAGSESIPIETFSLEGLSDGVTERDNPALRPHRLRLDPPEGATQAEVRFRVPFGAAAVTAASLQATDAVLGAGNLRPAAAGAADPWTQTPAAVPGFTRLPAGSGTRLRNAGTQDAVLAQTVSVTAGSAFTLEIRGRSQGPLRPVAAASLHWLAGDAPLPAPAFPLEVPPGSFDGLAAAGTVPEGADRAELRVTVPPGATLDVERIDLRFPDFVTVPVNFIAEAPGEVSLLGWQIAWNERDLPPPPVPATGLCPPTRAGRSILGPSTSKSKDDCCDPCDAGKDVAYCPSCEAERSVSDVQSVRTAAGRPAFVGTCPECGAQIVRSGGRVMAGAVVAATPLPVLPSGASRLTRSLAAVPSAQPVTRITGIGRARARLLRQAGLGSLEAIATSDPATLRRHLPGVTEAAAGGFINAARELLRRPAPTG